MPNCKVENPCTVFGTTTATYTAALVLSKLIDVELLNQNITLTEQVDDPLALATVLTTIVPPNATEEVRTLELLQVMYLNVGWKGLTYDPTTGIVIMQLEKDYPTNMRTLMICEELIPSCRCHY